MKVLYYTRTQLSDSDGPSTHVLSICRELSLLGHDVTLLSRKSTTKLTPQNFRTINVPSSLFGYENWRTAKWLWHLYAHAVTVLWQPDVIYERQGKSDTLSIDLSLRTGTPRVIEVNGWSSDKASRPLRIAQLRAADAIITTAPGRKQLAEKEYGIPAEKLFSIVNGVDTVRFRPGPVPSGDKFVVGFVGFSHEHHDVGTVLRAMSILANRQFPFDVRLIGDSEHAQRWKELSRRLSIEENVHFLGRVAHECLPQEIWKMHVCLAIYTASLIKQANSIETALKLWEYWAARKPVIATDIPTSQSYKNHLEERYLAVPPEDPLALANALERLRTDRAFADRIAENGHKYALERNSWRAVAKRIESVLLQVLH